VVGDDGRGTRTLGPQRRHQLLASLVGRDVPPVTPPVARRLIPPL
jgi:hypothetical protein